MLGCDVLPLLAPRAWGCPPDGGGRQAELLRAGGGYRGGACDVGGDNIGRVPVQAAAGPVISHRGPRVRMGGGFLHVAQRDPGIQRSGDERVSQRVRTDVLGDPARRATRRTIRPGPCRSSRRPSPARNTGPSVRSPMARSIARAVRGASGMVTTLPPLRVMVSVRWPRSRPRCSMSAPVASDTRRPFWASSEICASSPGGTCPAGRARRRPAARRARCGPGPQHGTHSPAADGGRARPGSDPGVLLRRRICRTRQ